MRIADYAEAVRHLILKTRYVASHSLAYEDRPPIAGLIKGSIAFADGSRLHFMEFVQFAEQAVRLKYAYHYVSQEDTLIFRYDNARDPAAADLPTYPDHEHRPGGLAPSGRPSLEQVLLEASQHVKRP